MVKCPKCGSEHVHKIVERTQTGRRLLWGGAVLTLVMGIGIPIAVVGFCLKEEKCQCGDCQWTWKA